MSSENPTRCSTSFKATSPAYQTRRARNLVVLGALAGVGCSAPRSPLPPADHAGPVETVAQIRAGLIGELRTEILASYHGDYLGFETRPLSSSLVDPGIGGARIGAGPEDVHYGFELDVGGGIRWPLTLAPLTKSKVVSRQLRIQLSSDAETRSAWASDEVSREIPVCGKTAAFPLRITGLYARDGYQWYPVFEHVSYARPPAAYPQLRGARMADGFPGPQLVDYPDGELGAPLAALLSDNLAQIHGAPSAPGMLLVPGPASMPRRAGDASRTRLSGGPILPEDRRVGLVGGADGTVAYWIGNFTTDLPSGDGLAGGKVRLRGTFVFEKRCAKPAEGCRPDTWVVVQGHLSEPIDDDELAQRVFGSAAQAVQPLRFNCKRAPVSK